ncbi:hypothetical protein PUNSTDRAFT_143610 [Punctularia strigosozonata HHB-11173 SS5]|uniref:uncharacterized protein n=1 Tax=Punctularia strigosozonata (strain HHB-11173) TaxID=741275 RepID=UPI00044164C9|nr:uncharacterized protein PUNSTDRAFT_143610 [Punctularia strigosozonata HHB-11173 SS5]EIN08937.1 hypothetical protein PUNSTDRAFT_143610 [Punctularia strigosozonata HHB-11173 SS5]
MATTLGLDPSDPLNLLIHNAHPDTSSSSSSSEDDSQESSAGGSPPSWNELSTLWSSSEHADLSPSKAGGELGTGTLDLFAPMDMDFDPHHQDLSVDPAALHFDAQKLFAAANDPTAYASANPDFGMFAPGDIDLVSMLSSFTNALGTDADPFAPSPFTTTPDFDFASSIDLGRPRRSSVTSSSSSSGASLSPVIEPRSSASSASSVPNSDISTAASPASVSAAATAASQPAPSPASPADALVEELAQLVRQNAGVMLAVPTASHLIPQDATSKLPIPHLPASAFLTRPSASPAPASSSSPSSPPCSRASSSPTPTHSSNAPSSSPAPVITIGPSGRPKTDHTTIERRYRTNLNARIQSLKAAVPALRVVEFQKQNSNQVSSSAGIVSGPVGNEWGDVIDDRGFVDGVKVARKISKANVLGKAVEYIRVLKKREARLAREHAGLRALVCGLVGGPALLREWEREWVARFGGCEADEVEGDEMEGDDEDEDDGEDDEDGGRARKRPKVAAKRERPVKKEKPAPAVVPPAVPGAPEKRKRGRPRKNPLPAPAAPPAAQATVAPPVEMESSPFVVAGQRQYVAMRPPAGMEVEMMKREDDGGQSRGAPRYLLAAFAFFSVFNSPLAPSYASSASSTAAHHAHTGSVRTPASVPAAAEVHGWTWQSVIQAFHLLVSALVLLSIVLPWLHLPKRLRASKLALFALSPLALATSSAAPPAARARRRASTSSGSDSDGGTPARKPRSYQAVELLDALAPAHRGEADEAPRLRHALGVKAGLLGLLLNGVGGASKKERGRGVYELRQLEQRAWVRLGELVAADDNASAGVRVQTYWCMRSRISPYSASPSDLSTLALVVRPLAAMRGKADALWARALRAGLVRPHERLVLGAMSVDEAAAVLRARPAAARAGQSPLRVIAAHVVRGMLKRHAALLFSRAVLEDEADDGAGEDAEKAMEEEEEERRVAIAAGVSLGGETAEVAEMLDAAWACRVGEDESSALPLDRDGGDEEDDVKPLVRALALYRHVFPSRISAADAHGPAVVLSPPTAPALVRRSLRRLLDLDCFEGEGIEDANLRAALGEAKDRANDMLVELERAAARAAF